MRKYPLGVNLSIVFVSCTETHQGVIVSWIEGTLDECPYCKLLKNLSNDKKEKKNG
jgi:hypothetical protein